MGGSLRNVVGGGELDHMAEADLGELKAVVEVGILERVHGRVDVGVRVREARLERERRAVAVLGPRGVVRAAIAALPTDKNMHSKQPRERE